MLEGMTEREREEEFYKRAEKREELKKRCVRGIFTGITFDALAFKWEKIKTYQLFYNHSIPVSTIRLFTCCFYCCFYCWYRMCVRQKLALYILELFNRDIDRQRRNRGQRGGVENTCRPPPLVASMWVDQLLSSRVRQ